MHTQHKAKELQREDYRDRLTVTIDPQSAKDYDDALSFKKLPNGNYEVGIHIADVSHFVKPGSEMDKRAREKTTSIYLVGKVLHMLPKSLSENEASLREGADKFTFSVVFELDGEGEVLKRHFAKTLVQIDYGLTYAQAQDIIDKKVESITSRDSKSTAVIPELADALTTLR